MVGTEEQWLTKLLASLPFLPIFLINSDKPMERVSTLTDSVLVCSELKKEAVVTRFQLSHFLFQMKRLLSG